VGATAVGDCTRTAFRAGSSACADAGCRTISRRKRWRRRWRRRQAGLARGEAAPAQLRDARSPRNRECSACAQPVSWPTVVFIGTLAGGGVVYYNVRSEQNRVEGASRGCLQRDALLD